jgi:putative transposase
MIKTIRVGQLVYWKNEPAIVLELKGLTEAIIRMQVNRQTEVVSVSSLSLGPTSDQKWKPIHLLAEEKEWDTAVERYELIKPLLDTPNRQLADVKRIAEASGKSQATLYRWLQRFEETGLVSSLLRSLRADKGKQRLDQEAEEIIALQIKTHYMKREPVSICKLARLVREACLAAGVEAPNKNTVYARVREIEQRELTRAHYGPKKAKERYEPLRGKFPGADYPNAVVQIDHTKVDVIVVDEEHRLPIGRPYLTMAIDVASKMIGGFRLTLDPPGSMSAGLCIAHAVGRKDHWLAKRDVAAEWPIYGKMRKIHVDNAKEFRGKMLSRACQQHGIILEHRPRGQPNYGPHIERAFRTFMAETHSLPGTTFSNIQEKLDYDAEGHACMTLAELELWLTVFIVYYYHHQPHKGITDVPPIKRYYQYVHGNAEQPGIGLPAPIQDEETFRLDFTPYVERTVQRDGVVIDNINYYSPILRRWIDASDPNNPQATRKFIFARDPRDISVVYFLDPEAQTYVPIPYFNSSRPAVSLWELRAATNELRKDPGVQVDEQKIFEGIARMREIEVQAVEKTRLAKQHRATEKRKRRTAEQRKGWVGIHRQQPTHATEQTMDADPDADEIEPFSDIQIGGQNV